MLDLEELDRLEGEHDKGTAELTAALDYITRINMRCYADRFVAALAEDAIVPEDF